MAFNKSIHFTSLRENEMGSSLARYFDCCIHFNTQAERRAYYDYCLYNIEKGWLKSCEQTDDYFTDSMDGYLCLELYTIKNDNSKKLGKINYTKADKFIYVINNLKKVIIIDVFVLKNFIARLEASDSLKTIRPDDHQEWKDKHDTLPTICALLPIEETLLQDPKSRVIPFNELTISNYYDRYH